MSSNVARLRTVDVDGARERMAEPEVEREHVRMRAAGRELAVEAVPRFQRDLVAGPNAGHGLEVRVPAVVRPGGGDPHSSPATAAGSFRGSSDLLCRPGARPPELVQGDDGFQAFAIQDGRDDLGCEATIGFEHLLEGRIVVGAAAVVLHDLPSGLQFENDRLRPKVDRALSPK